VAADDEDPAEGVTEPDGVINGPTVPWSGDPPVGDPLAEEDGSVDPVGDPLEDESVDDPDGSKP